MATATAKSSIRNNKKLTQLTPTEFENLLYDICVVRGMINVAWRTPGADGGRDIEAFTVENDVSGFQSTHKWFIECKRYTGSVDWPTIYGKLAYADSLQTDRLLICTSSQFTPAAITQVDNWNQSRRKTQIRLWPSHEIESQLRRHPDLLTKYGLSTTPLTPGKSIVSLALALSKTVSSSYSEIIFRDEKASPMLQASQAIADLLLKRMEDLSQHGKIRKLFTPTPSSSLDEVEFAGDFSKIDEVGIRALCAYLQALTKSKIKVDCSGGATCTVSSPISLVEISNRYRDALESIAIWSDTEYKLIGSAIEVRQRQ